VLASPPCQARRFYSVLGENHSHKVRLSTTQANRSLREGLETFGFAGDSSAPSGENTSDTERDDTQSLVCQSLYGVQPLTLKRRLGSSRKKINGSEREGRVAKVGVASDRRHT